MNLRDLVKEILTSDDEIDLVMHKLTGAAPTEPNGNAKPKRNGRTRTDEQEIAKLVDRAVAFCKQAGDDGKSKGEIVEHLGISPSTFPTVRKHAGKRLHLHGTKRNAVYKG